jgi:hypothetical protein
MKIWFYEENGSILYQLDLEFLPSIGDTYQFYQGLPTNEFLRNHPTGVDKFNNLFDNVYKDQTFTVTSIQRKIKLNPSGSHELNIGIYGKLELLDIK